MMRPSSETRSGLATFLDWLGRSRTGLVVVVPLFVLAAYHLVWLAGGEPYSVAQFVAVAGCVAVVVVLTVLARIGAVHPPTAVRTFLAMSGIGSTGLGVVVLLGGARFGSTTATNVVGALTFVGGLFVFFASFYLNPSMVRTRHHAGHVDEQTVKLEAGTDATLRRFRGYGGRGTDRIVSICEGELSVNDLHYLAYYVDGGCRFYLDVLDDPTVEERFGEVPADRRRDQYLRHGVRLDVLLKALNRDFKEIDSGILLRVVLDVERGALYYFYVDEKRFLIGVTLDQEMVHKTDAKMVHVVDETRVLLGHKKILDLNR